MAYFEIVDFDQVGIFTSRLLVTSCVDLKLKAGHLLRLSVLSRFEVDDRDLVRIGPPNQVNAAAYDDAIGQLQFDRFLSVFEPRKMLAMFLKILAQSLLRSSN